MEPAQATALPLVADPAYVEPAPTRAAGRSRAVRALRRRRSRAGVAGAPRTARSSLRLARGRTPSHVDRTATGSAATTPAGAGPAEYKKCHGAWADRTSESQDVPERVVELRDQLKLLAEAAFDPPELERQAAKLEDEMQQPRLLGRPATDRIGFHRAPARDPQARVVPGASGGRRGPRRAGRAGRGGRVDDRRARGATGRRRAAHGRARGAAALPPRTLRLRRCRGHGAQRGRRHGLPGLGRDFFFFFFFFSAWLGWSC